MHIAYLYSRYPVISQTFCDTEMLALERLGFSFEIGSIYPPLTSLRHEHAARLKAPIHYAPPQHILRVSERKAKAEGRWPNELIERHDQEYGASFKASQRARNALYFADLFARHNVEHLHVHFANRAAHTALFLKALSGIPFSVSAHGQDYMVDLGNDELLREICREAEFVAAETDYSRSSLAERCPDSAAKIHRVYNGMDLEEFPHATAPKHTRESVRILSVGRLVEFKGFGYLIDACAELARGGLPFTCEIIGDGPLRQSLQTKIDQAGLSSQVFLRGSLSQERVFHELRSCDIFALAAIVDRAGASDVFPTVILEAMASARPVVSTRVAGIPESVVEGKTGLLVSPNNSAEFAEALAKLIRDPGLRSAYGTAGRKRIKQHFQIGATVAPLAELFRKQAGRSQIKSSSPGIESHVKRIAYLIDRWPDPRLPYLEDELLEMERRSIVIVPFVCEVNEKARLSPAMEQLAPRLVFLPDAMVIEAEWQAQRTLARKLEDDRASEEPRPPAAIFLRQARFALFLRKMLLERDISHLHATSSRALVTALLLQKFFSITISGVIERAPALGMNWIESALRRCAGGRISDRRLLRGSSSSFLFDKAATRRSPLEVLKENLGMNLTKRAAFWQEWSERLVRWSRLEAAPSTKTKHLA